MNHKVSKELKNYILEQSINKMIENLPNYRDTELTIDCIKMLQKEGNISLSNEQTKIISQYE